MDRTLNLLKRHALLLLSLLLYCASLPLIGVYGEAHNVQGSTILQAGWLAFTDTVAWFANIAYVVALVGYAIRFSRVSVVFSLVGLALGLDSFRMQDFIYNTASPATKVTALGEGFYVWMVSFAVMAAAAAVQWSRARRSATPPPLPS